MIESIIGLITSSLPQVQSIYLFGSQADGTAGENSDVDIALLLPPADARELGELGFSDLRFALEKKLAKSVDLINLRLSSTVFQNEICNQGRRIYCTDKYETELFEMLVLSYYCKLNEERGEILKQAIESKRYYAI
ncbi:nucleotidyltransferase family protein [Oceanispirochaeta sp.]|jgi:predicted nucleotidyltransferase|uniref:type VII toxin-antitoxin system MntA family adenylyltransferase antitoxin n=1 Tax=Oceanispirochaeta sp. TaxID=2035350 RepID=UPI00261178FF|nr:nucleotidyltransferase domain-containing protein [Oceanispirochaeta sp.]MDA3958642.1 nucleotidyltransferase domain-containing protein [Oceanispirochaeta sp.]